MPSATNGSKTLTPLDDALASVRLLGIDAAPLIYFIEQHPDYIAQVRPVFHRIDAGNLAACVSMVALTEVLTQPYRVGNTSLAAQYRTLLRRSSGIRVFPVTTAVATRAALLRAHYNLSTPDALHLATAIVQGCDAFLTNDVRLRRVTGLRVLVLSDLAAA